MRALHVCQCAWSARLRHVRFALELGLGGIVGYVAGRRYRRESPVAPVFNSIRTAFYGSQPLFYGSVALISFTRWTSTCEPMQFQHPIEMLLKT